MRPQHRLGTGVGLDHGPTGVVLAVEVDQRRLDRRASGSPGMHLGGWRPCGAGGSWCTATQTSSATSPRPPAAGSTAEVHRAATTGVLDTGQRCSWRGTSGRGPRWRRGPSVEQVHRRPRQKADERGADRRASASPPGPPGGVPAGPGRCGGAAAGPPTRRSEPRRRQRSRSRRARPPDHPDGGGRGWPPRRAPTAVSSSAPARTARRLVRTPLESSSAEPSPATPVTVRAGTPVMCFAPVTQSSHSRHPADLPRRQTRRGGTAWHAASGTEPCSDWCGPTT